MSSTTEPAPVSTTVPAKPLRDRRGWWRILLAIIVVLPMPAKGVYYMLTPVAGDVTFQESVTSFEAHRGVLETLKWFDAVFVVTLIPATIAVAWVARRGAPRLTTAGAVIALTGFLVGMPLLGGVMTPALVTVQHDLDVTATAAVDDALHHEPLLAMASLLFILGIVLGLGLLGGALKRSRAVPAWVGIAVMLGGATHPFIPNHIGQGIGLFVAAAGFAGVSVALLRMTNDEFDLPAVSLPDRVPRREVARRRGACLRAAVATGRRSSAGSSSRTWRSTRLVIAVGRPAGAVVLQGRQLAPDHPRPRARRGGQDAAPGAGRVAAASTNR